MSNNSLTELVLSSLTTYGTPVFVLVLWLGAIGIPVPGTLMVVAVGAFARLGILNGWSAAIAGWIGVIIGDSLSYGMGLWGRNRLQARMQHLSTWQNAQETFTQMGGWAIFFTRFALTPLAVPTNLIAGSSGYKYWRFLLFDISGELTWIVLFGGLGYAFSSQWEVIADFAGDFSGLLAGLAIVGTGVYWLRRRQARRQAHQQATSLFAPTTYSFPETLPDDSPSG